jgi:hypothetical protein
MVDFFMNLNGPARLDSERFQILDIICLGLVYSRFMSDKLYLKVFVAIESS